MKIEELFHDALDRLYQHSFFLAEQVSKLGYPELVTDYPLTAGVSWTPESKKIRFMFNAKFVDMITDEQFCFVVAHEAMHIVNGHVFMLKTKIDTFLRKKKKENLKEYIKNFGIASDCVVNDSLIYLYGVPKIVLPKIAKNGDLVSGVILYGQDVVKTDCHTLSVQNVIDLLPKSTEAVKGHELWDSFFDKNGNIDKNFTDTVQDLVEECSDNPTTSSEDHSVLDDLQDALENCTDINAKKAGKLLKSGNKYVNKMNAAISWERLLVEKVDYNKFEDVWSRPVRNMYEYYPDIILPGTKEKECKNVFVAIDVSSSINHKIVDLFISVVKNTPPHIKITAVVFNTKCTPIDLDANKIICGGGTKFSIIEEYIQENLKEYPEAVFVLTDGYGNEVCPEKPKKWCWLLYSTASIVYCKDMTYYRLEDLLK